MCDLPKAQRVSTAPRDLRGSKDPRAPAVAAEGPDLADLRDLLVAQAPGPVDTD